MLAQVESNFEILPGVKPTYEFIRAKDLFEVILIKKIIRKIYPFIWVFRVQYFTIVANFRNKILLKN